MCLHSRYEQFLNSIVSVQNAKHCFLSIELPTCSADHGRFSFCCSCGCLGWFVFLESTKGPLFIFFQVLRSSGGGLSILKHYKNLTFSLKSKKEIHRWHYRLCLSLWLGAMALKQIWSKTGHLLTSTGQ